MMQTGIAGAEIVKRNTNAEVAQGFQSGLCFLQSSHHGRLGDLDLEPLGRKPCVGENGEDLLR